MTVETRRIITSSKSRFMFRKANTSVVYLKFSNKISSEEKQRNIRNKRKARKAVWVFAVSPLKPNLSVPSVYSECFRCFSSHFRTMCPESA
jgi:hypothetical protein